MIKNSSLLQAALEHPDDPMIIDSLKEMYEQETGQKVSTEYIKNFLMLKSMERKRG